MPLCLWLLPGFAVEAPAPVWDTQPDTWVATDALGRSLPTIKEARPLRRDRYVGVFYFVWLGQHGNQVYDNSKFIAANPADPQYGPLNAYHHWGEPLWGYYLSTDEAVIRKQAQMLVNAGVDMVFLDATNAVTYDNVVRTVCRVWSDMRRAGQPTPQIAFITWTRSGQTVKYLYDHLYATGQYPELWFHWKGRPLILAKIAEFPADCKDFFTVRESWAWTKGQKWFGDGKDKWAWIDNHPQNPGWHDAPDRPEQISVCVAQHPVSNIGRSFHDGKEPAQAQWQSELGLCFAEQWKRAIEVDPEFVLVTGWNEWIAMRFISKSGGQPFLGKLLAPGGSFFVDEYSPEFSRDIEPMKGGFGDNYYYQLISNIRKYKGVRPIPGVVAKPITIDGKFDDWKNVEPEFRDAIGDPVHRNDLGYDKAGPYVNNTGRNDIVAAKVSVDQDNVYFYVRTKDKLTPSTDPNWMLLFLDVDANPKTGWLGYDFVVNRTGVSPGTTTIEKNIGGKYEWGNPVKIQFSVARNELELAIPRTVLGIKQLPAKIDFKWADNIQQTGEAADFDVNGDAAPDGRFNFRARLNSAALNR
ncbi:MAG: hypothetical protein ABSH20_00610 [Tepidisphaeraceae bacterium]